MKYMERLTILLTTEQKRELNKIAHENYMTMSDYIRKLVEKEIKKNAK